ncbi:MAG: hypothetical protein IKM73_09845 [Acidaminococcaceae bacterium]|nr:hypothetical protein [Acidaminococcaceae bacterium]
MTPTKIRIPDDTELRARLEQEYRNASQAALCRYALLLAAHTLKLIDDAGLILDAADQETVREGLRINELRQEGKARIHDVRQAGFGIHRMAKASGNAVVCAALRAVGHAVSAAHMSEHAMVASDYAVKVICLLHSDCMEAVREERLWQIHHLQEIKRTIQQASAQ